MNIRGGREDVLTTRQKLFLREHLRVPDEQAPGEAAAQVRDILGRDQ